MTEIRAPARERCAFCGRPARGRCSNCRRPFCSDHGVVQCSACNEPLRPLPSHRLYRGTVLALAVSALFAVVLLWQQWPGAAPGLASGTERLGAAAGQVAAPAPDSQSGATTVPAANYIEYTIKAGDTLGGLTTQFNTTLEAIMGLNPGLNPSALQLGQVVRIPLAPAGTAPPPAAAPSTPTPVPSAFAEYTVRAGDTLWDIATLYSTTVEALVAANGLEGGVLRVGMVIRVPRS